MMKLLLRILGAVLVAFVIWFAGPLLAFADYHPLEPEWVRAALIATLLGAWIVRQALRLVRTRSGNRQLFDMLAAGPAKGGQAAASPQVKERFDRAANLLKTMQFGGPEGKRSRISLFGGKRYAYQLPWYIFIGAPGSGKTTALKHSGLQFPLADELGTDPFEGVGGTRHCDWWFTDQAVLIDTAGRYTTQDSNARADAAEWKEFVRLIQRFRPRQPINGVLATISAADLLNAGRGSEAELQRQAQALHARIAELQSLLGHRFPVYLLVTKTDLLPGFTQFFEELTREQREQVWGCTFDFREGEQAGSTLSQLGPQLDALESRLFAQMLGRLQSGRDSSQRALSYDFPNQWVQLRQAVQDFAGRAFAPSRLTGQVWLRGVYFTSGTQEGTPIDRVLGSLARSFGIERKLLPPQKPSGKSFFLTRLLRDVVFAESNLAGTSQAAERRLRRLKWGGMFAAAAVAAVLIGGWTLAWLSNEYYIDEVQAKTADFRKAVAAAPPDQLEPRRMLSLLEAAGRLAETASVLPDSPPVHMRAGLFQGEKLQAGAEQAYGRLLSAYLAPYVSRRIESGMRRHDANPELQYETLKAYLMLHRHGKMDVAGLKSWVAFDLETDRQPLPPEAQQLLLRHMDALLERDSLGPDVRADVDLVRKVRQAQLQAPFAQRVYNRIRRTGLDGSFKEFRLTDAGGTGSQIVFTRRSGQPLAAGVPGLYTANGYFRGFNPRLQAVLAQLAAEEEWVLGVAGSENARRAADPAGREGLADEVRRLYLADYVAVWERYIADIALVKSASLSQSIEQARILSGADSPLPRLIRGLAQEVTLAGRAMADKGAAAAANDVISQGKEKLGALLGANRSQAEPQAPRRGVEAMVDDRFEALRRFARSPAPKQPAPVDMSVPLMNDLYTLLTATEAALKAGNTLPQSEVPNRIRAEAARMPEPARSMLGDLADASLQQAVSSSRGNLNAQLAALVGEPCHKAITGRYPFTPGSKRDVIPEDFVRLFARGGLMDEFFQKNMAPLVDTSTRPWRFRNLGDPERGGLSEALVQFERAQEIRRVFFPPGSAGLSFRVEMRPVSMDRSVSQSILDVDGQLVSFSHASSPPLSVQWPGPRGTSQISLQLVLASGGEASQVFEGPWALFRLFDRASISRSTQPERFRATFTVSGLRMSYEVATNSVQNPFRMPELQAFQCPAKL